MPAAEYPAIPIDFGHWFAGFVDGEGCFYISQPRKSFCCAFNLSLRKDDRPILEECLRIAGVGYVHDVHRTLRPNESPQTRWEVGGKVPCLRLIAIFDQFPLRAKKRRDFAIWREAVIEWNRVGPGKGIPGADWSRMAMFKERIINGRRYKDSDNAQGGGDSGDISVGPTLPEMLSLPLDV